jgi:hypothetical protein
MANRSAANFGNEQALDWLSDLLDEQDVYFIHNTLEIIADYPGDEGPNIWDCHCALAAAEMVAAARGKPPADFPEAARRWLQSYPLELDEELMGLVQKALDRIELHSELKDSFAEGPGLPEWYELLGDLRNRTGL